MVMLHHLDHFTDELATIWNIVIFHPATHVTASDAFQGLALCSKLNVFGFGEGVVIWTSVK